MLQLNYKVFGEGPPVIILHGLLGMLDNWQSFAKKLAKDYQVFIVDQRNHGRSPHENTHSYEEMSADLLGFMDALGLEKVYLIGHSMGGKTIIDFALKNEERIEKMVVVDIGVKTYKGGHEEIIEALLSIDFDTFERRSEVDAFLATKIENVGIRMFLLKNLDRRKEGGFQWKMNLNVLAEQYENIQKGYLGVGISEADVMFAAGAKSRYILEEDHQGIRQVFPRAKLISIPDAGHWVHAEQPEALYREICRFFD